MKRLLIITLLFLASCGSGNKNYFNIENVEVTEVVGEEYPSAAVLNITLNSSIGAITLKSSRLRFGVEGRRQVVVTFTDKVKFRRGWQIVTVPIKISVVHNSLTVKLQEALAQHESRAIEVDGEIKIRRGLFSKRETLSPTTLDELLTKEQMELVWSMIDENRK
ncbi:MAG: hypothetical protein J6V27_05200 [Alistipes sp.]|nr:hypothetical protein [Alistipes sp.]